MRPSRFGPENKNASSGGYQDYNGSQFGENDDFMSNDAPIMPGSPRSAFYPDNYQQMGYPQQRFIHSDETVSMPGDYCDGMVNNLSP